MTPKDKARELVKKFAKQTEGIAAYDYGKVNIQCAIIAVEEIINAIDWHEFETPNEQIEYWERVKTEIENL